MERTVQNVDEMLLDYLNHDVAVSATRTDEEIAQSINDLLDDNEWDTAPYSRQQVIDRAIEMAAEYRAANS